MNLCLIVPIHILLILCVCHIFSNQIQREQILLLVLRELLLPSSFAYAIKMIFIEQNNILHPMSGNIENRSILAFNINLKN